MTKKLTKCDFCRYWTGSGCRAIPDSRYCKEAREEYFQHRQGISVPKQKSLRSWDK